MSKRFNTLNGNDFMRMVIAGADNLNDKAKQVNALNVFPVPDGDTGTNMSMTLSAGVEELRKRSSAHLGKAADALSKGLLMGARGNSGVILSQLFRGFAKHVHDFAEVDAQGFAAALQSGVDTAYKAVVKPVEGTILTVSREAARYGVLHAKRTQDVAEVMREVFDKAQQALNRTPDLLPVLKQVGVVDAGGQGLVFIYEGFLAALEGTVTPLSEEEPAEKRQAAKEPSSIETLNLAEEAHHERPVQAKLATGDIEFGYCTEFLIKLAPDQAQSGAFREASFRESIGRFGDSLLVVADDDLVKVHIHAEYPGEVLNFAMKYGELTRIKIENMREQHSHILRGADEQPERNAAQARAAITATAADASLPAPHLPEPQPEQLAKYGMVAIASGDGIKEIFASLGVDVVLSGGQTMNPSTENIVEAIRQVAAETVYVLPNNSNIILAAQQAQELVEEKRVIVIPSKTIPQGFAAALAFSERADAEANAEAMNRALNSMRSGQVTYAVRDTEIDGVSVRKGDYIGILDNRIAVSEPDLGETCRKLLAEMIRDGEEVVAIYSGEGASEQQTGDLARYLKERYPDLEVEVHSGGQPVYAYIFSVE